MDISDKTKAGIVDALGGVGVEMAKEFVLRQRQQQAMEERKEMEMELAETRARAMNQTSASPDADMTTDTSEPAASASRLGGNGSFRESPQRDSKRPSVSSELAEAVVDELATMSRAQRQAGYREVQTFDNLIQQNVTESQMRDAMENFDVITPIIADTDV